MAVLHKFNFSSVFFRDVSVALLSILRDKIVIWNRIGDKEYQDITIPFFYDLSGDERYLQDFYYGDSLDDCIDFKITEGNTDKIPRGAIRLTDININTASLINRFVRGEYRKENEDGNLITHNAPLNHIPLDLTYECKIIIDGELNAFKVVQRMIETFYRTHSFVFIFNGFTIKAQTGFPESGGLERTFEHSYGDDTIRTVNFTLGVETYLPVIDETLDFLKSQQIEKFNTNVDVKNSQSNKSYTNSDPMYNTVIPNNSLDANKGHLNIPSNGRDLNIRD